MLCACVLLTCAVSWYGWGLVNFRLGSMAAVWRHLGPCQWSEHGLLYHGAQGGDMVQRPMPILRNYSYQFHRNSEHVLCNLSRSGPSGPLWALKGFFPN